MRRAEGLCRRVSRDGFGFEGAQGKMKDRPG